MTKYQFNHDHVTCICGTHFSPKMLDNLEDELHDGGINSIESAEDTVKCPTCQSEYELSITMQRTVQVISSNIELIASKTITAIDGEEYPLSELEGLSILDSVPLPNGEYRYGMRNYYVMDERLVSAWMIPDADQMTLEDLEMAL